MRNTKMVNEALGRMKRIGLEDFPRDGRESVIHLFAERGQVFVSKPSMGNRIGALSPLNEAEQKLVDEFENQQGALVYHVIRNEFEIGVCYSFLYVSKEEEEWAMDRRDLESIEPYCFLGRAYVRAYVVNVGYVPENAAELDGVGEIASIGIENGSGGLVRKA